VIESIHRARRWFAEDLRVAASLRSNEVVEAFARVPRERFIGPPPWCVGTRVMKMGTSPFVYQTFDGAPRMLRTEKVAASLPSDMGKPCRVGLARQSRAGDHGSSANVRQRHTGSDKRIAERGVFSAHIEDAKDTLVLVNAQESEHGRRRLKELDLADTQCCASTARCNQIAGIG